MDEYMYYDIDSKFYDIQESKELYCLLTGLSYTQIGIKFYLSNTNKFVYRIRKLMKRFNLCNRRQLAYFAVINHLITPEKIKDFSNDRSLNR